MALSLDPSIRAAHDAERVGGPHAVPCHAPFTNLYFDQFGRAIACCLNTDHVLGTYPEDSVNEIWTGPAATKLREAMDAGDFALGCQSCHSSITDGNFSGVHRTFDSLPTPKRSPLARLSGRGQAATPKAPRSLEFALSNRCNLECEMCSGAFSSSIQKSMGLPALPELYDLAFVDQIEPFLIIAEEAKFYGGEPFLVPVHYELWERIAAVNPGCQVVITTNGTVMTDRVRQVVETLEPCIVFSLDGFSADTYEAIRVNASHKKVMANFEEMYDRLGPKVSVTVCPMPHNWQEIPDLLSLANERSLNIAFNIVWYPASHSLRNLESSELERIVAFWRDVELPRNSSSEKANALRFRHMVDQIASWITNPPVLETPVKLKPPLTDPVKDWVEVLHHVTPELAVPLPALSPGQTVTDQIEGWLATAGTLEAMSVARALIEAAFAWAGGFTENDRFGPSPRRDANQDQLLGALAKDDPSLKRMRLFMNFPPAECVEVLCDLEPDLLGERIAMFFEESE